MKMRHHSLCVWGRPLLTIVFGVIILTACEDKGSSEVSTNESVLSESTSDEATTIMDPVARIRYPEFERQERVERIAALVTPQKMGEEGFEVCATCHGKDGLGSRDGVVPRLAGQQKKVLIEKLVEIGEGIRHRPEMGPWLSYIDTDEEIGALANHISVMPEPVHSHQGTGQALALGEELFEQYCISCHGASGEGDGDARVPRIAGWDYASVRRTLIRQGAERSEIHETGMSDLVSMLNEGEIDALSDHVSRLVLNFDSVPAVKAP